MDLKERWTLHVNGSSSSTKSGAGLILAHLEDEVMEYAQLFDFPTTNNEAKYEVLLAILKITKELRVMHHTIYSDSQLVVG